MLYTLKRTLFTEHSTVGELSRNGKFVCYTLEDHDRGLQKDWQLRILENMKVPHQTAIPYGKYDLLVTPSARFGKPMPLIDGVPAFSGIRIHPGNTDKDTDGCVLVGLTAGHDYISQSLSAFNELFPVIKEDVEREPCQIEVVK